MGESWLIAISIGIVALAFLALVIYLILTLVSLRKTIETTNEMCEDLEHKMHTFDPLFRTVDRVGDAIEKRTSSVRQLSEEVEEEEYRERSFRKGRTIDTALEVAEWALVGLAIWNKMKERR